MDEVAAIRELQEHAKNLAAAQGWSEDMDERVLFLVSEIGELVREVLGLRCVGDEELARAAEERAGPRDL